MIDIIQQMLAPGLMISACGLLILGMNNKYSGVINRIRVLHDEIRHLTREIHGHDFTYQQEVRVASITDQMKLLHRRVWLVRNSVILYTLAVILFICSSIFIGIDAQFQILQFESLILLLFLAGMILVLIGGIFGIEEADLGYKIIEMELNEEKRD
jgi:hypothetical protein